MARRESTPQSEPPAAFNRKHLSRAEREARQRQQVLIGSAIVVVLVALLLAGGALYSVFVEPTQPMATIEDKTITRRDFYERVNYERFRLYEVTLDLKEQAAEAMQDPQSAGFLMQFFQQQLGQLQSLYAAIGSQTLEDMIEEEALEREAAARNIEVTDAEVDEEIRRQIARTEQAIIEADVTATAEAMAAATVTAQSFTPTPTVEPSATPTDTRATEPLTPTTTPAPTFTPAPTLTPNILAQSTFEAAYATFLTDLQERVGFSEEEFRRVIRLQLLREKVQEAVDEEIEVVTTEEQIHAAHILVPTQEEAEAALSRLQAGESFEEVAADVGTDGTAQQGGDLGWFGRDTMDPTFADAAFALTEVDQLSEPIETQFGWHIIKLLEPAEERPRDEGAIAQERQQGFQTWLTQKKQALDINRFWDLGDLPNDPFIDEIREPLPTPLPVPTGAVPVEIPVVETPASDGAPQGEATPVQ